MNFSTAAYVLAGLALLILGGEMLVRGAARLALALRISPAVVGLTVVAFGTSAPELAVSLLAAFRGQPDIGLGNVVGSNIFNVLFILGMSAVVLPLAVAPQFVRRELPLMIGISLVTWGLAANGHIGRLDGALLTAGLGVYVWFSIRESRRESRAVQQEFEKELGATAAKRKSSLTTQCALIAAGLALLLIGSRWLVQGAVEMARGLGVDELVIGLTIVAAGTSLPEVVASLIATLRGEREIAVGNVIGSNIFNLLCILGFTSLAVPGGIPVPAGALSFDIPVMLAASMACLPVFFTGQRIARWEGALFLGYYGAYTAFLILRAKQHASLPAFGAAMLGFFLPLTGVTLLVLAWRAGRRQKGASPEPPI